MQIKCQDLSIQNVVGDPSGVEPAVVTDELAVDLLLSDPLAARRVHRHLPLLRDVEVGWRQHHPGLLQG